MRYFFALFATVFQPAFSSECIDIDRYVKDGVQPSAARSHPCGDVVSQCLTRITETPELSPNWAYEISENGEVLKKWPMPVDGQIWGISEEYILVAFPNRKSRNNEWESPNFIKISTEGEIFRLKKISKSDEMVHACSDLTGISYLQSAFCAEFSDMKSGKKRIVSEEPVCS